MDVFLFHRHIHTHHAKNRKYSLPDDPSRVEFHRQRRVSTQPEDLPLKETDRDQLDSHRSDDPRALRRHKTSRPSLVHIGRKDGVDQLHSALMKKMYDHSPHAVRHLAKSILQKNCCHSSAIV